MPPDRCKHTRRYSFNSQHTPTETTVGHLQHLQPGDQRTPPPHKHSGHLTAPVRTILENASTGMLPLTRLRSKVSFWANGNGHSEEQRRYGQRKLEPKCSSTSQLRRCIAHKTYLCKLKPKLPALLGVRTAGLVVSLLLLQQACHRCEGTLSWTGTLMVLALPGGDPTGAQRAHERSNTAQPGGLPGPKIKVV